MIGDFAGGRRKRVFGVGVVGLQILRVAVESVNRFGGGDHVPDARDLEVVVMERRTGEKGSRRETGDDLA